MNKIILLRDNLSDQGQVPSPGSYCSSPDLICHTQVADPLTFFTSNYNIDVGQNINIQSKINLIYVRAKNLSEQDQIGYIHMYYSSFSLFLNPAEWIKNKLLSPDDKDVIMTGRMAPGAIGVGSVPFVFDAKKNNKYCHVGYISNKPDTPEIKTDFKSYSEYSEWIHNNTHICMRNFYAVKLATPYLENACEFSNPYTEPYSGTFNIILTKEFPIGTFVRFKCEQLHIDKSIRIEKVEPTLQIPISEVIPAQMRGVATVEITLPAGQSGTPDSGVSLGFYVVPKDHTRLVPYIPAGQLLIERNSPIFKGGPAFLIKIGQCTTVYAD